MPDILVCSGGFVKGGFRVVGDNRRFRQFLVVQWLSGLAAMALPFYVLQATSAGSDAAILLGAQTVGALVSNPFWGWWGDRLGKASLLGAVAAVGFVSPALALAWPPLGDRWPDTTALPWVIAGF